MQSNWVLPNGMIQRCCIKKMIEDIKNLQKQVNLPSKLSDLIKKEDFEAKLDLMADQCLESGSAVMSPRSADSTAFKKIFQYAFEGKDIDF